jgi:mRNA interferase MazF
MSREVPEQGEIWFANFDPVEGQEQAGHRPALVVSVNELNRTGLCMVVPGTTREKRYPARVRVPAAMGGLEQDTCFLRDQLRTVDRTRLRRYVGTPDLKYLRQVVTQTTFFLRLPPE